MVTVDMTPLRWTLLNIRVMSAHLLANLKVSRLERLQRDLERTGIARETPVSATRPPTLGSPWRELAEKAAAEMPEPIWQGPPPETVVVEPWVPSKRWEAAVIPPEVIGEYTETVVDQRAQWQRNHNAFDEAMRNHPNLVDVEESPGSVTYTLRGRVAAVTNAEGETVLGFDGSRRREGFAGPDLLKSSKGGSILPYVADDDNLDRSGRLAERAEMYYGTRDFRF